MLQRARDIAGLPFNVNSGYRCHEHNAAIGSRSDSSHPKGLAADIRVEGDEDRFIIVNALMRAGFTRVHPHKTYIHVDLDPVKPQPSLRVR